MNEIHSTTTGCWENNNKQRSSAFFKKNILDFEYLGLMEPGTKSN